MRGALDGASGLRRVSVVLLPGALICPLPGKLSADLSLKGAGTVRLDEPGSLEEAQIKRLVVAVELGKPERTQFPEQG